MREPEAPRPARASDRPRPAPTLPADLAAELRRTITGTAYARERAVKTLTRAAAAYDRHRFEEAARLAREVADLAPEVAAVRELAGLAAYRAERYPAARAHLRAHFEITGDPEHLPLVMDAERAAHHWRSVERVFGELSAAGPAPDTLSEGRIVQAGAWADQRRYREAIALLEKSGAQRRMRHPAERHVRQWYALADLYDRVGDATSARELFSRVLAADPDAYDVRARLAELGVGAARTRRARPVSTKRDPSA
ncbi:MAG TPA: tetratricopeptide repeat protein [Acidimicrobiales bacterium]|nr:tetratricopeptide repeat protein [Acidimicrobiales bacterium]